MSGACSHSAPQTPDIVTGQLSVMFTIGDIIRPRLARLSLRGDEYRVARNLAECRTPALGGHRVQCETCGHTMEMYNSCRDRHCPSCQGTQREAWVHGRQSELLPVPYFHAVFTLPDTLYPLVYANKRAMFRVLMRAASGALTKLATDPRWFGGTPGFIAVLHTWNQQLGFHPHLHCIIAGGALAKNGAWHPAPKDFFLPIKVLSRVYRGKFIASTKKLYRKNKLFLRDDLSTADAFESLLATACRHDWKVYLKPPFGTAQNVLNYLGRYTHRVAISNRRIVAYDGEAVTFTYRDRRDDDRQKALTLPADDFVRRFLLHILPKRFVKIRFYGFWGNPCKQRTLPRIRAQLLVDNPSVGDENGSFTAALTDAMLAENTSPTDRSSIDRCCPKCGSNRLMVTEILPRKGSP